MNMRSAIIRKNTGDFRIYGTVDEVEGFPFLVGGRRKRQHHNLQNQEKNAAAKGPLTIKEKQP